MKLVPLVLLAICPVALFAGEPGDAYSFRMVTPPGYSEPEVFGMNERGQLAGGLTVGKDQRSGFILDSLTGALTLVPETSILTAINDSGAAAGNLRKAAAEDPEVCAIRRADGTITRISPPFIPGKYRNCLVRGISPRGLVSGFVTGETGSIGFLHDPSDGSFEEFLPTGPGGQTVAHGINTAGQVAGSVRPTETDALFPGSKIQSYGFVRDADGSFRYFTVNANPTTKARDISDSGRITGFFEDNQDLVSFVIELTGKSVHEEVTVPPERLLFAKPCSADSKSPGNEWKLFGGPFAVAISNDGVVAGTCFDAWVLLDDQGKEREVREFGYGFIASPTR